MYSMRFDMRAPDFGAAPTELYEAAVDVCAWAETRGCLAAVICEHHGSPDGYLPTPLILGSAIAARTKRVSLVRIGDNMAVTDTGLRTAADLHVEACTRLPQSRTLGTGGSSFPHMMAAEARAPL